jgi:hypothetical protein
MRVAQNSLVNHSEGAHKLPSLIFGQDGLSSFPIQDGLIPGNHHNQLGSRATLSLRGLQEFDVAEVKKIEYSGRQDDFSASQLSSFLQF